MRCGWNCSYVYYVRTTSHAELLQGSSFSLKKMLGSQLQRSWLQATTSSLCRLQDSTCRRHRYRSWSCWQVNGEPYSDEIGWNRCDVLSQKYSCIFLSNTTSLILETVRKLNRPLLFQNLFDKSKAT